MRYRGFLISMASLFIVIGSAAYAQDARQSALQYLMQIAPGGGWQPTGMIYDTDSGQKVIDYDRLEVTVNHYMPFGVGPEQLFVGTTGIFGGTGVRLYSGSYQQNKELWDKAIVALRTLGVQ